MVCKKTICIYCGKNADSFDRDHVVPESFGKFKNNFVLKDKVCKECNHKLGNTLECDFGRKSFFGLERYRQGIKSSAEYNKKFFRDELVVRISEGLLKGAEGILSYDEVRSLFVINLKPQIGFRKKDGTIEYILLEKLPSNVNAYKKYRLDERNCLIIPPGIDRVEAIEALKRIGTVFKPDGFFEIKEKDSLCTIESQINAKMKRTVAKIAFNYLAYFNEPSAILGCDFNPIRDYVANGKITNYPLVAVDGEPILYDEKNSRFARIGHIITLDTADDGSSVLSQVSLFNNVRFRICLSRNCSVIPHLKLGFGHFFDFRNKKILQLKSTFLTIPQPAKNIIS